MSSHSVGDRAGRGRDRVKISAAVVFLAASTYILWTYMGAEPGLDRSLNRGFKCAACGHDFAYHIKSGDFEPVHCPGCGAQAGYQAEKCYWTKLPDGKWGAKPEPTYVLLKSHVDPSSAEKTYCPDCGHEVVGHNPPPPEHLMDQTDHAPRD